MRILIVSRYFWRILYRKRSGSGHSLTAVTRSPLRLENQIIRRKVASGYRRGYACGALRREGGGHQNSVTPAVPPVQPD